MASIYTLASLFVFAAFNTSGCSSEKKLDRTPGVTTSMDAGDTEEVLSKGEAPDTVTEAKTDAKELSIPASSPVEKIPRGEENLFLLGKVIYDTNCKGCHGEVLASAKRNRTIAQINAAILNDSVMKNASALKALGERDITLIEYALSHSPDVVDLNPLQLTFEKRPLIGSRYLVSSAFTAIFCTLNQPALNKPITDIIEARISKRLDFFGGPCNRKSNSDSCYPGKIAISPEAEALPLSGTPRLGLLANACEEILSLNQAVVNALKNSGLQELSPGDDAAIAKVFFLFLPGLTPSSMALTALNTLHSTAKAAGQTNIEAWKFVMYSMCISSGFDFL